MSGVDAVRGIGYQHAHAVLTALGVLADEQLGALRVEGVEDVMDIEVHALDGTVVLAKQVKTRSESYSWGKQALIDVMLAWADLKVSAGATFEFVTDGRLGPSGLEVRSALESAAEGHLGPLAALLDLPESSSTCTILSRARLRTESTGVETVLLEAEREVRVLLPGARTRADLEEQARQAVNRLYRLLSARAGEPDARTRIVKREEVADALGGLTYLAEVDRWPGTLAAEYHEVAADAAVTDAVVTPSLVPLGGTEVETSHGRGPGTDAPGVGTVPLRELLSSRAAAILAGPTGAGKTTAVGILRHEAAASHQTVLVAPAETYLPGHLDALASAAMTAVVERDLSSITGRQLLNDPDVLLVIDGVSEVPVELRKALRDELRAPLAAGSGARVLVAGRDIAALKSVLPMTANPRRFHLTGLGHDERREIVRQSIAGGGVDGDAADHEAHRLASQVEHVLGDAAGNPMLFTMGLQLLGEGIPFTDRVSMYEATITRLAERGGVEGIDVSAAALGIVFARLLDEGRRYANPYEWARLVADAVEQLNDRHVPVDVAAVLDASQRAGLVSPIGQTQTLAPVHDSYADYLAGRAHCRRIVSLPPRFAADDEQRALFTAEICGVTPELARLTARDLPFLTVRMAAHDARQLDEDVHSEIAALLAALVPRDEGRRPQLWRDGERVVASLVNGVSKWVSSTEGRVLARSFPTAVCRQAEGPLAVAARLWRLVLDERLEQAPSMRPAHAASLEAARGALERHATAEVEALTALVRSLAPGGKESLLATAIGPFGLTALVSPATEAPRYGKCWPVRYRRTDEVSVHIGPDEHARDFGLGDSGGTSVDHMIRQTSAESAAARARAAINDMTIGGWL